MPVRAGTATPTLRLGTSAVSRMYLGSALAYSATDGPVAPTPGIPTPIAVTATATNTGTIVVQWQSATGPTGFQVQFSTNGGAQWLDSGLTATSTTAAGVITGTATLAAPTAGARYTFRVAATTASGVGQYSNASAGATVHSAPTTPTGLTGTTNAGGITLSWSASTGSGPIYYWVQYSADSGTTWSFLSATGTSQTYYNITIGGSLPLVPGTAYRFRVYAGYVPSTADSVYAPISGYSTATGSITAPTTVPGTPKLEGTPELGRLYEPFRTSVTVQNTGGAVVRFTGPTYSGGSAVTSYRVYDGAASTTSVLTIAASDAGQYERTAVGKYRTATVTWSAISAERYISVSAVNSAGESPKVTVRVPPIVDHVFQITSLTATPLAAGAMFSYPGGSTYAYSSAARAVTLAWSAPSATIAGMSANPQQPAFQIQVQSLASSTQATVSENWTDVMPLLSGRPYSQSGNTIDFLSPATPYVARVRAAYLNGVYGPFSYVTFTTVS